MKKNSGDNIRNLEVDPITGHYYVVIPEWVANDLSWYEDTEIEFQIESGEVILREYKDD
jgi:hypothetical protein